MTEGAPIRVAVVGCGRISRNHFDAIEKINGLELAAVCDIVGERARAAGERYGVPSFESFDEMLASVRSDVVALCTPSGMHPRHGVLAARAGKHVVCEKPMAISLEDADELVRECDAAGVQLFVVKQNRLNPAIQLLKRAIDRERFGRIYLANTTVRWTRPQEYYDQAPWRGTWEFDGGAIMNQASHYVDLIQWLVGPVESVVAKTATLARRIETEDTGIAVNRIEHWSFADYDDDDKLVESTATNPPSVYGFGHEGYYRNVLAVLRGHAKAETDGRAGRKSLELILGIYESAKTGRDVPLPLVTRH